MSQNHDRRALDRLACALLSQLSPADPAQALAVLKERLGPYMDPSDQFEHALQAYFHQ